MSNETKMPRVLKTFLESLQGQYATLVYEWIENNRYAQSEMLNVIDDMRKTREEKALRDKQKYYTREQLRKGLQKIQTPNFGWDEAKRVFRK